LLIGSGKNEGANTSRFHAADDKWFPSNQSQEPASPETLCAVANKYKTER
jgi:hypothetical protein